MWRRCIGASSRDINYELEALAVGQAMIVQDVLAVTGRI